METAKKIKYSIQQGTMDKIVSSLVRQKLYVSLIILICTAVVSFGAFRMKTEVILSDLFPYDHPYLQLMG